MRVVVPFDATRPKTRLAPVLDPGERAAFARAMLDDVLATLAAAGVDPEVLATAPLDPTPRSGDPVGVTVTVDERPLTPAVDAVLAETLGDGDGDPDPGDEGANAGGEGGRSGTEAVAVVMADLPLATSGAVERLLSAPEDVVLVPGRGGGTNAFVARHPGFRVDYHGVSYRDHRRIADEVGAEVGTVDSYRLSTDVDERGDLPEVLLHGRPRSREWLRERGFRIDTDDENRVTVVRENDPE